MKANFLAGALCIVASGFVFSGENKNLAEELTKKHLIIDGHVDVPYRLTHSEEDVGVSTKGGDFDFPRAKIGGLNAPFMSIYVPAEKEAQGNAKSYADSLIDKVEAMVKKHPDKFAIPRSIQELQAQVKTGLISLPLGIENGAPIEGDLANLRHFSKRGVRYITLTHSKSNHISDSSYDENRPWEGLSAFGKRLVREMNREGVMIDISHVSDDAFWQVVDLSAVPIIASHSSARHFTPGFERNMSDEMIKALADNGGIIMVNFGSTFISEISRDSYAEISASVEKFIKDKGFSKDSTEVKEFTDKLSSEKFIFADLKDVLDHFDHVRNLVGVDHIGIGSDFDGVGDSLPTGLKDVSQYPNLVQGLLERGYSKDDIEKILGANLVRVWQANEEYAKSRKG
ncbi:dipeptidase [Microbulbifer sp. OS29]|uniref:Dipeptidase n=1 Tax=Microbulbifer okhotskensis TaxID=2926617 RepID=A0A9X2EJX2_9GAMM|nr:dipeptidase [Microbulbifer okhotskensis]MCO1333041.1 dipeptidase [Microbulbifer okhotskensis]